MSIIRLTRNHGKILFALLFITSFTYFKTLFFDFVNWDDDYYVLNNLQVSNPTFDNLILFFTQGNTANYHPLTMLSLAFNYLVGGENASGYHLFNLVFHLLNTILLYSLIKKIWPEKTYLPLFVSGIFALHPMHVESVAWISSRKDVLFVFFYLGGLIHYIKYTKNFKVKSLIITLLFFLFSILSKPTAVIFPIHLLLIDYLVVRKFSLRLLLEKIPFFIGSILIGLATVYVQSDAGAVSIESYSFIERLQLASYAINMYISKFFIPLNLSSFYPYPTQPFNLFVSASPLILIAILGLGAWRWKDNRTFLFGIAFFLVSLVLLVQLVTVGSTIISERYTYLAYIGFSISLYVVFEEYLFPHFTKKTTTRNLIIISLSACSVLSFYRVDVWENGETLWTDAIEKFPEVAGSWGGRGVYYRMEKEYDKSLRDFNQAVALNPDEAMFYSNRGNIFFDLKKDELAMSDYNNCLRLDSTDEKAYANRGAIHGRRQDNILAIKDLTKALSLDPSFVNAYMNRGIIYSQMNKRVRAKDDFKKCLELKPDNDEIWNALAVEHQHLAEFDSSILVLNKAISLKPNQGLYYLNRGISHRLMFDQQAARLDFDKAKSLGQVVHSGFYEPATK